jgi:hypothetical protein
MFQGTAYGVAQKEGEEKLRLTLRQPLAELVDRKKGTVEQARKAIASIVSDDIRGLVSKAFEERISKGKSAPAALAEPVYQMLYGKRLPIAKASCYTDKYAEEAIVIVHNSRNGEHRKYLLNEGYAYLEIKPSVRPRLVSISEAMREKSKRSKNDVARIYKGDTVKDMDDGLLYRVCYFKAAGIIALLPVCEPRSFKEANEKAKSGTKMGKSISFAPAAKRLVVIG